MKTLDFYKLYNLKDIEVVSISPNNGDLSIMIHMETHSDFVANGFRTEFDFSLRHRFTFLGVKFERIINTPVIEEYKCDSSYLYINIGGEELKIPNVEVKVEQDI